MRFQLRHPTVRPSELDLTAFGAQDDARDTRTTGVLHHGGHLQFRLKPGSEEVGSCVVAFGGDGDAEDFLVGLVESGR